jgi:hypothetical protein
MRLLSDTWPLLHPRHDLRRSPDRIRNRAAAAEYARSELRAVPSHRRSVVHHRTAQPIEWRASLHRQAGTGIHCGGWTTCRSSLRAQPARAPSRRGRERHRPRRSMCPRCWLRERDRRFHRPLTGDQRRIGSLRPCLGRSGPTYANGHWHEWPAVWCRRGSRGRVRDQVARSAAAKRPRAEATAAARGSSRRRAGI